MHENKCFVALPNIFEHFRGMKMASKEVRL